MPDTVAGPPGNDIAVPSEGCSSSGSDLAVGSSVDTASPALGATSFAVDEKRSLSAIEAVRGAAPELLTSTATDETVSVGTPACVVAAAEVPNPLAAGSGRTASVAGEAAVTVDGTAALWARAKRVG
jgi:hypothetical protein